MPNLGDRGHKHQRIFPQSFPSITIGPEKESVLHRSQHSYHESEMHYGVIPQKESDVNISLQSSNSYGVSIGIML